MQGLLGRELTVVTVLLEESLSSMRNLAEAALPRSLHHRILSVLHVGACVDRPGLADLPQAVSGVLCVQFLRTQILPKATPALITMLAFAMLWNLHGAVPELDTTYATLHSALTIRVGLGACPCLVIRMLCAC